MFRVNLHTRLPVRNLVMLALYIFSIEFFIMYFVPLESESPLLLALIDSLMLLTLIFPILLLLLYRPLKNHISELEQTKDELIRAKQLAENASRVKSEFVANMSHEIRTPLTSILGNVELLKEGDLPGELRQSVNLLEKGSRHLLDIVNDILDLSAIESGQVKIDNSVVNLESELKLLCDIFSLDAKKSGLSLNYELDEMQSTNVITDSLYLRQILGNLIANAIKFTTEGEVTVSAVVEKADAVAGEPVTVHFAVKDSGVGIPPDKLETIFESFSQVDSTTKRIYGGTGLGLYISRKLIELLGGKIGVKSEEGVGSTFFFSLKLHLPAETLPPVLEGSASCARGKPGNSMNILVVEDTEEIVFLIKRFLSKQPYAIDLAENGLRAVEKFSSNNYQLILMDMEMPIMDGYTATQKIRAFEKEQGREPTPIVALTAHAYEELKQKSLSAGCNAHLLKPFKKADLIDTIESYQPLGS